MKILKKGQQLKTTISVNSNKQQRSRVATISEKPNSYKVTSNSVCSDLQKVDLQNVIKKTY